MFADMVILQVRGPSRVRRRLLELRPLPGREGVKRSGRVAEPAEHAEYAEGEVGQGWKGRSGRVGVGLLGTGRGLKLVVPVTRRATGMNIAVDG